MISSYATIQFTFSTTNNECQERTKYTIGRQNILQSQEMGTLPHVLTSPKNNIKLCSQQKNLLNPLSIFKIDYGGNDIQNNSLPFGTWQLKLYYKLTYTVKLDKIQLWLIMTHTRWKAKGKRIQ